MKTKRLCVPYLGSKRKHADKLISKMLELKPDAKYFYDLCGGGGAISFEALQRGMTVFYNDKQTDIVEFIKFIFERSNQPLGRFGMFPDEFYSFVPCDKFNCLKTKPGAYAQFMRICYSFGSTQKWYIFNSELEKLKHLAHNCVVFNCKNSLTELQDALKVPLVLSSLPTINERKLEFTRQMPPRKNTRRLRYDCSLPLPQLDKLQRLEELSLLQQFKKKISFTNLSYERVCIETPIDETIVYFDPPYRGTARYIEGLCHNQLDDYFANLPYLAFMSEYSSPFKCIHEIKTLSTLSASNSPCSKIEKLYINQ